MLMVGWSDRGVHKGQRMNQKGDYGRGLGASKPGPLPRKSPTEERRKHSEERKRNCQQVLCQGSVEDFNSRRNVFLFVYD